MDQDLRSWYHHYPINGRKAVNRWVDHHFKPFFHAKEGSLFAREFMDTNEAKLEISEMKVEDAKVETQKDEEAKVEEAKVEEAKEAKVEEVEEKVKEELKEDEIKEVANDEVIKIVEKTAPKAEFKKKPLRMEEKERKAKTLAKMPKQKPQVKTQSLPSSTAPTIKPKEAAKTPQKWAATGKLELNCVLLFQQAYGLNGHKKLSHTYLIDLATSHYECSPKAVHSLLYGYIFFCFLQNCFMLC